MVFKFIFNNKSLRKISLFFDRLVFKIYERIKDVDIMEHDFSVEETPGHVVYQPTNIYTLISIVRRLEINDSANIIDLGCGKGRSLLFFSRYFENVTGLEYDERLANIAYSNITKLNRKNVNIIKGDARTFEDYKDFDWIFMYNPFGKDIMREVMLNIENNVDKSKKVNILYFNPIWHEEIIKNDVFKFQKEVSPLLNLYQKKDGN